MRQIFGLRPAHEIEVSHQTYETNLWFETSTGDRDRSSNLRDNDLRKTLTTNILTISEKCALLFSDREQMLYIFSKKKTKES